MKKITSIILGLSVMIALVFVPYISKGSNVQSPNPFTEWDTLSDAEAEAGFSISLPDQIEGYDEIFYRASKTHPMIEVIFHNGEGEIRFRKAPGTLLPGSSGPLHFRCAGFRNGRPGTALPFHLCQLQ